AHEPAGIRRVSPALADADAPMHRIREVTAIVRECVAGLPQQREGQWATQIGVERSGGDDDPRVEEVARVEEVLEPLEGRDGRLRGQAPQQRAPRTTVAVLPGQ